MRRDSLRQSALAMLTVCLGLSLARGAQGTDEAPRTKPLAGGAASAYTPKAFPAGVKEAYGKLSAAILEKDLPSFMKIFDMDFIFEARDGSCLDRGPWRRLWSDRFEQWDYEKITFEMDQLLKKEDDRYVVRTRRIVVRKGRDGGAGRLQEAYFEDSWVEKDRAWQLWYQTEREIGIEGAVSAAGPGNITSPRLAVLARDLERGDEARLAAFFREIENKAPLVETIPEDAAHRWVTFVWRSRGGEQAVRLEGGLPVEGSPKPLERLVESALWYRTERLPRDARFTYEFHLESQVRLPPSGKRPAETLAVRSMTSDPLNPTTVDGKSAVALPGAPPLAWIDAVEGRPAGEVERHTVRSVVLDERRFVSVYTPPDYESSEVPCRSVFLLDRGNYKSRRVTATVLDNLLAERKTSRLVAFMVHSEGSRRADLELSGDFVRFLGEELVAWARDNFRVSKRREDWVIGGNGLGGALAALAALEYPGVLGGVLSEGGTFSARLVSAEDSESRTEGGWLARRFAIAPRQPLRFYLTVGCLESAYLVAGNRHLRNVLEAKGYPVTYARFSGNHHSTTWYDSLARGLMDLLSR